MWAQRTVLSVKNGTACHTGGRAIVRVWYRVWCKIQVQIRKADPVVVVALRHRSLTMLEVESDQIWVRGQ